MNKISCMIVTYNRWELLDRCLNTLQKQTCQEFDILVVDNGSSDQTNQYLSDCQKKYNGDYGYERLIIVTVPKNEGMANGYNVGYEAVFSRGYDWIWTMDDDGLPERNQLEELIKAAEKNGLYYLNSLVCDINNPKQLSFGLAGYRLTEAAQKQLLIYGSVNPDNGTFIHKKVFEACGNIMKELISYGMETEYVARLKKKGFKVVTVTTAIHYHPQNKKKQKNIIPYISKGYVFVPAYLDDESYFITIRNLGYIESTYYGKKKVICTNMKYLLFYLLRFRINDFMLFRSYYMKGVMAYWKK